MKNRLRYSHFFDVTRRMFVVDMIYDVSGHHIIGPIYRLSRNVGNY
jgi:hypothetical protein